MANVKGKKGIAEQQCHGCKQTIEFDSTDLRNHAHDADQLSVFVECPSCGAKFSVYNIAVKQGWIQSHG